ncbi:MAG: hypothetical protein HAW67_04885 [Endozoicomonadaceae bacterium]|nr:hypothetical protein [Endozoicomonadaceae bacterium]
MAISSHELARRLLEAPDGTVSASIDMPNNGKVFAYELFDIPQMPSDVGFGSSEVVLHFEEGQAEAGEHVEIEVE